MTRQPNTNSRKSRRILLVDDEPTILKIVGMRLERAGFEVVMATDGQEALAKARIANPDAILLDLMLPKLSGLEVCAALKQDARYRHIPIVIFTARGNPTDETLCRECGANAYIDKPKGTDALLEQIEILLGRLTGPAASSETPPAPSPSTSA